MTIRELQKQAFENAKAKGFIREDAPPEHIDQKLLMIVGELVEAQNELRAGVQPQKVYYPESIIRNEAENISIDPRRVLKPEGFGIELADAQIRLAELAEYAGIDLEHLVELKMAYNATREFRHGGKKF